MRKILTWRWGWSVSISRQDACGLYAVLTDALVTECSLDDDLKTHGMMTMTRDEVSEVRSTLSPDQETGAASASVCCVCQCSAQRSALPSLSRCARPRPLKTRPGPPVLLSSVSTGAPPVSWHWPGPASGSRGSHQWSPGQMGTLAMWPQLTSLPGHTHASNTHRGLSDYHKQFIFLQFAIFVPDTPTWYHGKWWILSSFIILPTLFLCLSTWHEIVDRSRKGNIWFILFHATLK